MMEKGTLLRTRTRTLNDVFGEVLWEVVEVGLPAPEKERAGQMDGMRCTMLGGNGPSARPGYSVTDSEWQIARDMAAGVTTVLPAEQRDEVLRSYDVSRRGQ